MLSPHPFNSCDVCGGPLELLHPGGDARLTPESMAPTNHDPGRHGDLYACRDCGTVHQPGLPRGEELAELYRGMSDDAYLSEEAGRRETARRLLDLIQRHVPAGSPWRTWPGRRAATRSSSWPT